MADKEPKQVGAKLKLLEGHNPETGIWDEDSRPGKVLKALEVGNFIKHAAGYAGLRYDLVSRWLRKGRDLLEEDPERDTLNAKDTAYYDFAVACSKARNSSVVELITLMSNQAQKDWRAAHQLVKLIDPETFGDRSRHDIAGVPDAPLELNVDGVSPAVAQAIARVIDAGNTGDEDDV